MKRKGTLITTIFLSPTKRLVLSRWVVSQLHTKRNTNMTPEEARRRAENDQAVTEVGKVLPGIWGSLFRGCLEEDFKRSEALELVKQYIMASAMASAAVENRDRNDKKEDDEDDT
jgi:hypothetical protein